MTVKLNQTVNPKTKKGFLINFEYVNLDRPEQLIIDDIQDILDKYIKGWYKVSDFKWISADKFSLTIERTDHEVYILGDEMIGEEDMKLLSGLKAEAFDPINGNPLIGPLVPWYDNQFHAPTDAFECLYEKEQDVVAGVNCDIKIYPTEKDLTIEVEFK